MPLRVLLSAVGFTFSLVFATQGCVQTFSDARRAIVSLRRCWCFLLSLLSQHTGFSSRLQAEIVFVCLLDTSAQVHSVATESPSVDQMQ